MILPSDATYKKTKRMRLSGELPPPPFGKLAAWISWKFGVTVLDIHRGTSGGGPMLDIILERRRDETCFKNETRTSYDRAKLDAIAEQYASLLAEQSRFHIDPHKVFIAFSAFEPVARIDANDRVTEADLERLKQRLNNPDLWTIVKRFESATFFFYTDSQAQAYEDQGLREKYAKEYARVIALYDDFGYFAKTGVLVSFDSKENFDTRYEGNWYNYLK